MKKQSYDQFCMWQQRSGVISCQVRTSPIGYLPDIADSKAPSTPRCARPSSALALGCTRGFLSCPATESTRNDRRADKKEMPMYEKMSIWCIVIYTYKCSAWASKLAGTNASKRAGQHVNEMYRRCAIGYWISRKCQEFNTNKRF